MKALVGAFNQEKALVGAFSVVVKTGCGTDGALHSTSSLSAALLLVHNQPAPVNQHFIGLSGGGEADCGDPLNTAS